MPNKVAEIAKQWEAEAIEKCRSDPELMKHLDELNICVECMIKHPCQCDLDVIAGRMRAHYDRHKPTIFGWDSARGPADNRPDPLMRDLLEIASDGLKEFGG